ncbi:MAG: ATP-binding protein, partial [Sphaerochaeta sp.]|nr:ATP-binding protein [Sphaerochaeta sp.]
MTYIPRMLDTLITERLNRGMAILVLGARRTGKTTLLQHLIDTMTLDVAYLNGDNDFDVALFERVTPSIWNQVLGNKRAVFIDEAQRIPNIGRAVKLLIDHRHDVQVFISGSSSFQVMNLTEEPLTGRKYEYTLHPFSFSELSAYHGVLEEQRRLEERLLFGSYPQVVIEGEYAQEHLMLLSESYLYRDLFAYDGLRKPKVLENLLKALAYQLGSEVSPSELGSLLGVHRATVESYL